MSTKTPLAVVGAGRVGLALARRLGRRGFPLTGIVARRRTSAARASRLAGRRLGTLDLGLAVARARVVLVCVPDAEIPRVAQALAALPSPGVSGRIVLHTCGALSADALEPARRAGAAAGSFHPLVSFPEPAAAPPDFHGVAFAVDGDPRALVAARAMARALGGVPIRVSAGSRGAYHLAASLVAGGLVALLDEGVDLAARRVGLTRREALDAFLPLVASVMRNVALSGPRRALTGPVVRGDAETVARHLEVLSGEAPALRDLYRLLSLHALSMAIEGGRLDPQRADRMRELLQRD